MFKKIEIDSKESMRELVKMAFQTDLVISGAWGYSKELSTVLEDISPNTKVQIQFTLATMRAYLEMNMTLGENERYAAINLNEIQRKLEGSYEKVSYEISAIKELEYNAFITEYKENLEKKTFDINEHFSKRKEATLKREVIYWFKIKELEIAP